MRYLTPFILKDLKKKAILLSGPRQCGKTTLAKTLFASTSCYLNWDVPKDKLRISKHDWSSNATILILDELHKFKKWKNFLKGILDSDEAHPPLLITGSARLETLKNAGDALTGRYFYYRLHPIDVAESRFFLNNTPAKLRLERLLLTGGFPESFLNPEDSERLCNDRFDLVVKEDIKDLSHILSLSGFQHLIEIIRDRGPGIINYQHLATDLHISAPTAKQWIFLLEKLFLIFLVYPYEGKFSRSIRKEPKFYFYDCAASYTQDASGIKLENLVACALLKFCHFKRDTEGKKMELHYFRDRDQREVDFVVTYNRKPFWLIEVKTSDDAISPHLRYLVDRSECKQAFQLVYKLEKEYQSRNIAVMDLANWLDNLHSL
ncbi:MAG: ATP-binding protein [Deltaproteobacteria bacterium]|nr:ATP-binding protein [Deltaproteobacteria bacterium]